MNKVYKTILNRNTGCSVVTSELAKGKVKSHKNEVLLCLTLCLALFFHTSPANAVTVSPPNGTVVWGGTPLLVDSGEYLNPYNSYFFFRVGDSSNVIVNDNVSIKPSDPNFVGNAFYIASNVTASIGNNFSLDLSESNGNQAIRGRGNSFDEMSTIAIGDNAKIIGSTETVYMINLGFVNAVIGDGLYVDNSFSMVPGVNGDGLMFNSSNVSVGSNAKIIAPNIGVVLNKGDFYFKGLDVSAHTGLRITGGGTNSETTHERDTKVVIDDLNLDVNGYGGIGFLLDTSGQGGFDMNADVSIAQGRITMGEGSDSVFKTNIAKGNPIFNFDIKLNNTAVNANGAKFIDIDSAHAESHINIVLNNTQVNQSAGVGNSTSGDLTLVMNNNSVVDGGVENNGGGEISITVDSGSELSGGLTNNGGGNIVAVVGNGGIINGNLTNNSDDGVIDFTVGVGGTLNGDVIKNGAGDLNLSIEKGGVWSGSGSNIGLWVKANASYALANSSSSFINVKMDDNSLLDFGAPVSESAFKTLHSAGDMTQSGSAANVYMGTNLGLGKGDLIAADGALTGNYIVSVNNYGGSPAAPNEALRIVQGGAGSTATVALTGNQYRDAGLYRYHLVQDNSGAGYWLVNGDGSGTNYGGGDDELSKSGNAYNADGSINSAGFTAPVGAEQYSDLARTLKSTAASQTVSMLNQSRNVAKHIDGIRQAGVKGDHATTAWVNHFYNDSKIDASVAGTESKLNMNATYLGADKSWDLGGGDSFVAGMFAGAGFADNDYHINGSEGDSDIYTGGIYGMWLDDTGLFADMTAQVYRVKTQSNAYTEQGQRTDYDIVSHAFGLNLDIGKRYELDDGFYIEPELKLAYLRDGSDEFTTRGASNLKAKKTAADVFQYGAGLSLGKTIATATPGSSIQPYLNIELLGQSINGGDIESTGTRLDNDLNGHQLRSDLGVNWQINKKHRLFAEVSAGTGETYSNTFSAGLGYQMKF